MKTFGVIMKVVAALAAAAGVIYVVAAYGDKIVAWAKELLAKCPCCQNNCNIIEFTPADEAEEAPAEEAAPAAEEAAASAEEPAAPAEGEPLAEETDFEE